MCLMRSSLGKCSPTSLKYLIVFSFSNSEVCAKSGDLIEYVSCQDPVQCHPKGHFDEIESDLVLPCEGI